VRIARMIRLRVASGSANHPDRDTGAWTFKALVADPAGVTTYRGRGALPLRRLPSWAKLAADTLIERGEEPVFKTIMWATDGTGNADRALPYAKALAQEERARLVVAHVIERYASHKASALAVHADEEQVEAKLKKLEAQLSDEGFGTDLKIVSHVGPQPAHEIADIAREVGADLIVVGCRGRAAITGLMVGSVTQRLLHVAPCPVLVVPPTEVSAAERA
jgi:nucleotide-binding universal stress UspA family protein